MRVVRVQVLRLHVRGNASVSLNHLEMSVKNAEVAHSHATGNSDSEFIELLHGGEKKENEEEDGGAKASSNTAKLRRISCRQCGVNHEGKCEVSHHT